MATILVNHQQTRFHIADNDQTKEIDIKDLDISIKLERDAPIAVLSSKAKASKASRVDALEILSHAHLRIKTGVHHCFVGRNGAGKTTVIQSIAQSLIPGLDAISLRIASLEQRGDVSTASSNPQSTVLDYVTTSDPFRRDLQRRYDILNTASTLADPKELVLALRKLQLEDGQRELELVDKEARLRSGARGYNVRAELLKQEGRVQQLTAALESLHTSDDVEGQLQEKQILEATQLMADLQSQLDAMPLRELLIKAKDILTGLGFTEVMQQQNFHKLSGGWQMRCLLAAALVQSSDLLLLDEPTNHLDMLGILWLQRYLIALKDSEPDRSVVVVSHDRQFVNEVCEELIILKDKKLVYYPGNLDSYDKSIYRERLRLGKMKDAQDKQIAHIKSSIADNKRQGKKNNDDGKLKQAKMREKKLNDRMGMEVSAKGTRFKLNRDLEGYHLTSRAEIEVPHEEPGVSMAFPSPSPVHPAGSLVSLENVSLKFKSAAKPVLSDVTMVIHPGDRIGILGLNGAGKSTLIKVLTNTLPCSTGTMNTHPRLKLGYYSQLSVDRLSQEGKANPQRTSLSLLLDTARDRGAELQEQPARALLGQMGLPGRVAADTPVANLSGGQLVRLALSILLLDPPQLFVLDEPTTHLDVYTVTALAKALQQYDGAILLVTHDRFFMRAVVEREPIEQMDSEDEEGSVNDDDSRGRRLLYTVGAGKVTLCAGGVDAWEASLEKKLNKMGAT